MATREERERQDARVANFWRNKEAKHSAAPAESQGVERAQPVEPEWVAIMSDLLDALKRSRNLLLSRGIAFSTADHAIVNAERFMPAEDGSLAHPYHAHSVAQPVEGPRETTCKCIGGKYGYCNLCTHAHIVEACCADLRPPVAPVEGVERVTVAPTVWIVGYTANDKAGILSRGLFFRSIHDSKEAAEKYAAAAFPDSMERPTVTPYFAAQPVERVTDDAPARVEPKEKAMNEQIQTLENGGLTEDDAHNIVYGIGEFASAQPAKHTDDRPAETIPAMRIYPWHTWEDSELVKLDDVKEREARAETRIEVLEAALRNMVKVVGELYPLEGPPEPIHNAEYRAVYWAIHKSRAALAAPSGEKEKV